MTEPKPPAFPALKTLLAAFHGQRVARPFFGWPEIHAAVADLERAEQLATQYDLLARAINDDPTPPCDPACNTYGHTPACDARRTATAVIARLITVNDALRAHLRRLTDQQAALRAVGGEANASVGDAPRDLTALLDQVWGGPAPTGQVAPPGAPTLAGTPSATGAPIAVTRVEVIDHRTDAPEPGRHLVVYGDMTLTVALQDAGRTAKLFLDDRATPEPTGP